MHIDFLSLTIIGLYFLIIMVIGYTLSVVHFKQLSTDNSAAAFWRKIAFANNSVSKSATFSSIIATLSSEWYGFWLSLLLLA